MLLKSLFALALLSCEAVAIQVQYVIYYRTPHRDRRIRNVYGITVTDAQATRIKSNMFLWSQGHYTAEEDGGFLKVKSTGVVQGPLGATDTMLENMQATLDYHVRGPGAPQVG